MARSKRTIRASEIGSFIFCQRAWRYQRNEVKSINVDELAAGEDFHRIHVNQSRSAGILGIAAWILLIVFFIILSLLITGVLTR
jgi:hypothetical protein